MTLPSVGPTSELLLVLRSAVGGSSAGIEYSSPPSTPTLSGSVNVPGDEPVTS